jgi:sugar fermentation stimulation protein A
MGTFRERINRFVARIQLEDGGERLVHVASSGRMTELLVPGAPAVIEGEGKPGQKTAGRLAMVRHGQAWVSVDTSIPGKLLRRAFAEGVIPAFAGYTNVRPEYTYGESRIDFLLTAPHLPPCLVEVKSVTSALPAPDGALVARFPDAPTARGARHLRELAAAVAEGYRAAVFFVAQRADVTVFGPWDEIDPEFGDTLRSVTLAGVEAHAWKMRVQPGEIVLAGPLPLRF